MQTGHFDGRRLAFIAAVFALMFAAANLRGGLVIIGPLVSDIRTSLDITAASFGVLMSLPLICFSLFSLIVPWMATRIAPMKVVALALAIITLGSATRLIEHYPAMVIGTLGLGMGIAVLNVLIPSLVKGLFPQHSSWLTGLYTLVLTLGAGVGVLTAVPLRDLYQDWHAPLAAWTLMPLLALVLWLPMLRVNFRSTATTHVSTRIWRLPKAWSLALFMGLQSTHFYILATWLPRIFMDADLSDAEAGLMTALFTLCGLPGALLAPVIAARRPSQRGMMIIISLIGAIGVGGLMIAPAEGRYVWVMCLGLFGGSSLSLSLALIAMKSHDMRQATALSAMVQSTGYLIASVAPSFIGAFYDAHQSWTIPLTLMLIMLVAQTMAGWPIGGAGKVDDRD